MLRSWKFCFLIVCTDVINLGGITIKPIMELIYLSLPIPPYVTASCNLIIACTEKELCRAYMLLVLSEVNITKMILVMLDITMALPYVRF